MALAKSRWHSLFWLALFFLLLLWPTYRLVEGYYRENLMRKNAQTLELFSASLLGTLQRYEVLPYIIGQLPNVQNALLNPQDPASTQATNLLLEKLQQQTGADVIYLMEPNGLAIAASNWNEQQSFVGNNFSFRPYFREALAGGLGEFFGLGNISLRRGYYFASPVHANGEIIGVIVVKVDLSFTENLWGNTPEQLMVTDHNGVVILTSEPDWYFRATRPLTEAELASILEHQPYTSTNPEQLNLNHQQWISSQKDFNNVNWQISILAPSAMLNEHIRTAMAVAATTLLAVLLVLGLLIQRRHYYLERIALDAQAKWELEINVKLRTRDLQSLNSRLKEEVLEREAAQQELVRAQDELVQAGKLSALGVMSASISHELNQPLAAIRSYTDNGKILLEQQRYPEVASNLERIASITERMASIISHLKAFARRDQPTSEHVALQPALLDALALHANQTQSTRVEIYRDVPEATLWVEAGETRLRQILNNIISNALDALSSKMLPRIIWISAKVENNEVCLSVRDNGTGFTDEALVQAREPFFTTKASARGLGLGLAICDTLTRGLGGTLTFSNHPDGGALVELRLKHIPSAVNLPSSEEH